MTLERAGWASGAWHLALLSGLVLFVASVRVDYSPAYYVLALVSVAGFLIGLVWLGRRVPTHEPFRQNNRFFLVLAGLASLFGASLFVPRAFYQWERYENDSAPPAWANDAGMGLAGLVGLALLMLTVWVAWAILVRTRDRVTTPWIFGALFVAVGAWLLGFGAVVFRTDYTSEDILFFTMPFGIGSLLLGVTWLLGADLMTRWRTDHAPSKKK